MASVKESTGMQRLKKLREEKEAEAQTASQQLQASESLQRVKAARKANADLQQKKSAQQTFLDSDENVGFWDAMLPGGATPSQYKESRQKKKQYEKEAQEAAAQVAAYEQFWEQQKVAGKTSAEIDLYLESGDKKIEKLEEEKVGFFEAMKPGGVKPSERKVINAEKEAEIKKLESQQGMYRAVRDEKKSREMTDNLPEDVKGLLDEFNNLVYEEEGTDWAGVASGFAGMSGSGGNAVQRSSSDLRIQQIKKELTDRGYDNWVELAEYRKYVTDKEAAAEQTERWADVAEEHPVLASAGARAMAMPSAVAGLYGTIKQGESAVDFEGGTPYSPYYNAERARQTIDTTVTENFEDGILSADAKAFLYGAGTSALDSTMASILSGSLGLGKLTAGEVLLGLGAANSVLVTASKKGMTQEQALTTAAVAMASEIAFEHLSLGKLSVFEASGEAAVKSALKDLIKNSFVNMTEEMATEIANVTFDYYYNGGLSDYYQNYETYIAMGYSEEEAEQMARADVNNQIFEAGLSGAVIGGVFSSYESGANAVNYNSALKDAGKQAVNEGKVDNVLAGASDIDGNEVVSDLIGKVEAGQSSDKLKGKDYKSIGKLIEQLDKVTGEDRSKLIETAVKNRLTELGEADGIDVKTSAITKVIENGGRAKEDAVKLTKAEKKAIKKGTYTQRVLNEIGDAAGMHSSAWADTLGEDVDSLYKRRYEPDVEAYKAGKSSQEDPSTASGSSSLSGTEKEGTTEQKKTASGKSESEVFRMLDDDHMKAAENAKAQVKQALVQPEQDENIFNAGFELYYEQGRSGGFEFTEVKENPNVSESFTEYQRQQAFEQGQHQRLKDVGNARYKGGTVAVFVNGYSGKDTVNRYAQAFDRFYAEGAHTKKSFDDVLKNEGHLFKVIDEGVARKAFEEGRKQPSPSELRSATSPEGRGKKAPKKAGSYRSKTIEEGDIDTFFEAFAGKLGMDVERVQRIADGEYEANAQVDLNSGKMVSSASSRNEYQSSIHESVHIGYAYGDKEKMAEIEETMKDYFVNLHGASVFENVLRQYEQAYPDLDRAGVMEEFTADALAGVFSSEQGINEFVDWIQTESGYSQAQKKTILEKLSEWLLEIIDKIRELVAEGHLNDVSKEFANAQAEQFADVREKFLQVLDEIEGVEGAEGVKKSYAGPKAKTGNVGTLEQAQKLEDVGKATAEEIRQQTGWFRGMDGMWRFEIDDSKMKIRDIDITSGETKLSEVLDHPELFEAYPQLKDVTVSAFPSIFHFGVMGRYNSERKEISMSDEFLVNTKVQRELAELKKSPEYREYKERLEKAAREHGEKRLELSKEYKGISQTEEYRNWTDLYYQLDDIQAFEKLKEVEKAWRSSELGKRYYEIQAELKKLDEINPQADIEKEFRESDFGKRYRELEWDISGKELTNNKETRNTLIHEIQHAVQDIEGFSTGASPEYWNKVKTGYTPSEMKRLEAVQKKASDYFNMIEDEDIRDDAHRLWYLNDHYFDDNIDSDAVDKEIAEIEARGEAFGYTDTLDRYFELQSNVTRVFNEIEKRRRRSSNELYRSTAGEIEARDASKRLNMNAEKRKSTRPDIDRKDVVFADGGVSYDFVGHTSDGIEVYETSKKIKELPYSERKKIFSNLMAGQFVGKTAKFFRNGHAYYAKFDESSLEKNIYGDKDSSPRGWKAKINVGADGNIFELVENSLYHHSKPEKGKKSAPHKKVNYWDYFVKTVQIDNMVYDVLINIRRESNRDYVYSIRLWENKKIKVSPPVGTSEMSSVNLGAQHSTDTISQPESSVKSSRKFSLDWIDFAEEQQRERSAVSELTELKKINEELRAQIRHPGVKHIVSQLGVQKVARHLKSEYMSKVNIHKLSGELGDFYTLIANGDGISWDSLQIHIERIADMILGESKYKKPDISDYAKDVLRDIRSVKIKLNDEQKSEVASEYGSYNEFRKRTMGTLVLSNEGISLDERWGELSAAYPHFFPEDTADTDQPRVLMEAVASLRETYEDMNGMDLESARDMLMTEIYEQYFEVPETKYISEEYKLKYAKAKADFGEKLREAKADFKKQRDEAYRKAKAEYGEILKGIREEEAEAILQAKARYNLRAEKMADTRVREKKRANVIKQVKRLDKLLRTPGKGAPSAGTNKYEQKYVHLTNIPESLKRTVIDFCSVFIEHDAGVFSGYKKNDSVTVREKKIEALQKQYALLKQTDVYLKESVVEGMAEKLDKVAEIMAERRLSQLTVSELDTVIEITDHLITVINNQVEMWVDGKKHKVEGLGSSAVDQLTAKGQYKHLPLPGHDFVKGWGVNNMKPVYFFERVGGVLEKLFLEMQNKGQRDYARNINAAAAFMDETSKKFAYEKWTDEDPLILKTTQGHTLKLTKSQAMHIWATAKREAIAGKDSRHIMQGGIVFEDEIEADVDVEEKDAIDENTWKPKIDRDTGETIKKKFTKQVWRYSKKSDGSAHRISLDDLDKISEYLTDEQKKFVDTMIGYLTNDMAALGNEVSMELYGIKRFNEKYYIPFNSAKNFIYRSMGEQGEAMLRSESFTKETAYGANNPLVVGDFLDVVAGHIERMAMYNSMVLPLENFSKIWNFKTFVPEGDDRTSQVSVRSAMETAFGKSYVSYVDTLLKDINGGINADSREKSIGRLLSNFKKTAVLGSASVVIQQPSAIVRAFAEIDPSYFVASTFAGRKKAWEKALKYSSTALLKDIGGFDTVSGRGTVDWLTKTEYKGKDKVIAFFKDSQYRDDIIAWGPGFADKVTWAHIWAACEREVAHDNKGLQGEELYKKTGERFDEVINKTQVYDSVLTRSAHMRSKSQAMQVVTSFMSEPTTQANMIASAMFNAKKGDKKKAARIYSSVILSQLFNAALVSAIYAARDDDEDKTLVEKYLAELTSNFVGSLNPLTMIPLFKDVWSLLEGYDVERSDMAVYADVVDSWKAWKSDSKTLAEKVTGTVGSIGNAFGLPIKNILRDAAATVNVAKSLGGISDTTGKGIFYALEESLFPVTENLTKWKPTTKEEKLYAAFSEGDKKMYNRIASQYTSGGKIKSDLKKQIGERFVEGDIDERTAISQFRKLGLTENEAYYEVRSLKEPLPEEESEDTNANFFDFDSMQSIQGDADAELEADRQKAEDEGEEYSEKGDYDWLEDELSKGDKMAIQKEVDDLKSRGVSESDINSQIKSWIKKNDSSVISEAQKYKSGNLGTFESTVRSVASKYGTDESTVAGAIRSAAGVNSKSIDGTIYTLGDIHIAMNAGDSTQTTRIASSVIEAKANNYASEGYSTTEATKKAKQSVRSSLTNEWKSIYLQASSSERTRIRQQLYATGAYDNLSHLDYILQGWREDD